MTTERVLELMKIEVECIKRANTCDRNCAKCELVQKDTDLLEAYSTVIEMLEDEIEDMNDGVVYVDFTDMNKKIEKIKDMSDEEYRDYLKKRIKEYTMSNFNYDNFTCERLSYELGIGEDLVIELMKELANESIEKRNK